MATVARNLFNSSVVLAAIPAILFTAGTVYRHGFLSQLSLDENVLDRNFHQAVYEGFINILGAGLGPLMLAVFAMIFVSYFLIPLIVNDILERNPSWASKIAKANADFEAQSEIEKAARSYTSQSATIFFWLFALLLLLVNLEGKGKAAAVDTAAQMKNPQASEVNFIYVPHEKMNYRLYFLTCGLRNCAGYEQKSERIIYYPQGFMSFKYEQPTN